MDEISLKAGKRIVSYILWITVRQMLKCYFLMDICFLWLELHIRNSKLTKKNVRDLYVTWENGPQFETIFFFQTNAIQVGSRHNKRLFCVFDWIEKRKSERKKSPQTIKYLNHKVNNGANKHLLQNHITQFYADSSEFTLCSMATNAWQFSFSLRSMLFKQFLHENNISFEIVVSK